MMLYLAEAMGNAEAKNSVETSRLAAIIFDRDDPIDDVMRAFVETLRASGAKVAGLVQEPGEEERDLQVRDLTTGERLAIMQDLGAESSGCAVDPAAIAVAARMIERARGEKPDLLVVNRFGRLESEGAGMIAEIGAAVAEGEAVLIAVPLRYRDAWNAFAAGLDAQVAAERAALEGWWRAIVRENASA
jgi:nucleoside-triphosphatase THEP1